MNSRTFGGGRGKGRGGLIGLVAALALCTMPATGASGQAGLPLGYDFKRIDSGVPAAGSSFGWGVASADLTGDGEADLVVAQGTGAQSNTAPTFIFIYDGVTGQLGHTITPPESNFDGTDPVIGFVYVETMPDLGSCPGSDGADGDVICDDSAVGPADGIPEIIIGARELQVDADPTDADGPTRDATDPKLGRGYVIDGARAGAGRTVVLKRIDMPAADRILTTSLGGGAAQFGRVMMTPQGLPPCAGPASEVNNLGLGPCPGNLNDADVIFPKSVRIGDVDLAGQPDIIVTARNFRERTNVAPGTTAPAGSQCATQTNPTPVCTAGKAWVYRGEDIAGSNPSAILETPLYAVKNPFPQTTSGTEFGGNAFRLGDIGGGPNGAPDDRPDFVIAARNTSYPRANPDINLQPAVGVAYLFNGANGNLFTVYPHPEPQARATFSASFNSGRPGGDLGLTGLPDVVIPAPLQNNIFPDDGTAYLFRGDQASAGGGGQGGWQFGQMDDPDPYPGAGFGSSTTGVGNLAGGASAFAANEMMIGSWGPFDPGTEEAFNAVQNVQIVNPQSGTNLQTIPDPTGERGSGFGVGMTPMGDLNDDGFLDFGITAYLSNGPLAGQGRAYILYSNNVSPAVPTPPLLLASGRCANQKSGTAGNDTLEGTPKGDTLFALRGDDAVSGLGEDDCLDGGDGTDVVNGGDGADTMRGRAGRDRLIGGAADDRLFGEAGKDKLVGSKGKDFLVGGKGKDKFKVKGGGADRVNCGKGEDVVIASAKDKIAANCERVKG
jgi:Ca2+-binding RTX toxin-like protein